ncbi:hypothetical protein SEA_IWOKEUPLIKEDIS_90 [Mycobacterium phage Iwokeuplikedis]|nr:hypothetical protein SEA_IWOKEUPLIKEDIS_90 [Mycobacterium phage Iwokeuplikedis]
MTKAPSWAATFVVAVWAFGLSMFLGELYMARAEATPTVDLTEAPDVPVCAVEDCSDQPGQVGMWLDKDTGNWWLSLGEGESFLVVDDTVIDID